jgi:hypothetical protein
MPCSQPPASNHSPHSSSWFPARRFTRSPAWTMRRASGRSRAAWRIVREKWDFTAFWASPK